jgi:hypothetical protein
MAGEAEHAAKATASVLIVVANCLVQAAAYSDCTKLPGPAEVLRSALEVELRRSRAPHKLAITDCAPDS